MVEQLICNQQVVGSNPTAGSSDLSGVNHFSAIERRFPGLRGGAHQAGLDVGYSPTPTAEILPKILRAFQRAMPNVHVKLHDWSNNAIVNGIRDGRLQLGLIVPPTKASALHDLRFEELFHERVCVAVARSIRLPDAAPFRLPRL